MGFPGTTSAISLTVVLTALLSYSQISEAGLIDNLTWRADARLRYGYRTREPISVATMQQQVEGLVDSNVSRTWSYQIGARLRADVGNIVNNRYEDLYKNDPPEIEIREANIQYRSGPLLIRAGNQLVVWGEAFGTFFADVVNPKDLREAGFGEISDLRKPIEILNLQYIKSDHSFQFIYVPFYRSNRLPRPGSDFFPLALKDRLRGVNVDFDLSDNPSDKAGDYGFRFQKQFQAFDASFFWLNMIDRQPLLNAIPTSFTSVQVRAESRRTQIIGSAMSWASDTVVVRAEAIQYFQRSFNVGTNNIFRPFLVEEGAQTIAVLGVDWPWSSGPLNGWQAGVQISYDFVTASAPFARPRSDQFIGAQLIKTPEYGPSYRFFGAISSSDGSWIFQSSAMIPQNENVEAGMSLWLFGGASDSQLGSLQDGNRIMIVLRGVLSG